MDTVEHEQIREYLKKTIPSELKKQRRHNFIRKCSVYRVEEGDKLFKVSCSLRCKVLFYGFKRSLMRKILSFVTLFATH